MTYIKKGYGFDVDANFARAKEDTPIELSPAEHAKSGHVIGYIKGDPKSSLEFMRAARVRVHVRKDALGETNPTSTYNLESPIYLERERRPKWNVKVGPLMDPDEGGRILRRRLPHFTKADHESAARWFAADSKRARAQWSALMGSEHKRVFGRAMEATDYKISGIGREEYSERAKAKLRELAHYGTNAAAAAAAHWKAAGHRKRMVNPQGPRAPRGKAMNPANGAGKFSLDVDAPDKVAPVLRAAARAYYDSASELESAWQERQAGAPWLRIALILERAAKDVDKWLRGR